MSDFNSFRDNYPAGFNGFEGEEEQDYLFEVHTEVVVDAEDRLTAIEYLLDLRMNELEDVYDEPLERGLQRFSIECFGEVVISSTSEEYAEEEFYKMDVKEALEKGLNITTGKGRYL